MDKIHKVGEWLFPLDDEPLDVGLLTTDVGTFVGFRYKDTEEKEHSIALAPSLAAQIGKALVMCAVEATRTDKEPEEAPKEVKDVLRKAPGKDWVN